MMIATFIFCSKRAFSDGLEGVALKIFLEASPHTPIFPLSSSTLLLCFYGCNSGTLFSEALGTNNFP